MSSEHEAYYHVRVRLRSPASDLVRLDLTRNEVVDEVVAPYRAGTTFPFGEEMITAAAIDTLRVSRTPEPSARRVQELKQAARNGTRANRLTADWVFATEGTDVTASVWSAGNRVQAAATEAEWVFVSYRRDDGAAEARSLAESLRHRLGESAVFHDRSGIEPGSAWPARLESAVTSADVVVAVLGPRWHLLQKPNGKRRIDDPEDWVRRELTIAVENGVPIVPVAIDAELDLSRAELVETIAVLETLQQHIVTDRTWDTDLDRLADVIRGLRR